MGAATKLVALCPLTQFVFGRVLLKRGNIPTRSPRLESSGKWLQAHRSPDNPARQGGECWRSFSWSIRPSGLPSALRTGFRRTIEESGPPLAR